MVRRAGLLLLVVVALLVPVAPAEAVPAISYVTKRATVPAGASGFTIKATCPDRTQVVGGGVGFEAVVNGLRAIASSAPFDNRDRGKRPDDGWIGSVNNKASFSATAKTVAVCSRAKGHTYLSAPFTASTLTVNTLFCPAGTEVSSGGVLLSSRSPFLELASTSPIDSDGGDRDNGWGVVVSNESGADVEAVQHAICSPFDLDYFSTSAVNQNADSASLTLLGCTVAGTVGVGGGVAPTTPGPDYEIATSVPSDDGDDDSIPADGWLVATANDTGVTQSRVMTRICRTL